jgi:uncharacterized membrane protein
VVAIFAICVIVVLVGSVLGIAAFLMAKRNREEIDRLRQGLTDLKKDLGRIEQLAAGGRSAPTPEHAPPPPAEEQKPRPIIPLPPEPVPAEAPLPPKTPGVLLGPRPIEPSREQVPPPPPEKTPEPVAPAPPGEPPLWQRVAPAPSKSGAEWWEQFEKTIGTRWMTWGAVLLFFLATGFAIKLAIDQGYLGPTARLALCITFGILLLGVGEYFLRRKMLPLGQGLLGGGVAILFVSFFGGFQFEIIGAEIAFACLAGVTVVGMTLAVLHDALVVAFIAVLGGLLTPVMISTGQNARDSLFTYLVLLDLGVLGVALFKRWRALDVLTFTGTWLLFGAWFQKYYAAEALVPVIGWLAGFYAIFLVLPFVYHFYHRAVITGERFAMALSHATLTFAYAYLMLRGQNPGMVFGCAAWPEYPHALGCVAFVLSACYAGLGSLTRRRIPADERALFGFIALSIMFLTMAVPLQLGLHGVLLAWAAEGPVLVYLGYRFSYFPARASGFLVLALTVVRLVMRNWPDHVGAFVPVVNREFVSALCVPAAGWLFAWVHHGWRQDARLGDRVLKIAGGIAAGFLAILLLHSEATHWFVSRQEAYYSLCVAPAVWAVGAIGFLVAGLALRSVHSRVAGLGALVVAGALAVGIYGEGMPKDSLIFLNARFAAALAVILAAFAHAAAYCSFKNVCIADEYRMGKALSILAGVMLLVIVHVDVVQWLELRHHARLARSLVVVVWTLGSAGFLGSGLGLRWPELRWSGLGALAVAGALGAAVYGYRMPGDFRMFCNLRFGSALPVVLMLSACAVVFRCWRGRCTETEHSTGKALAIAAGFLALLIVHVDLYQWVAQRDSLLARCLVAVEWALGSAAFLWAGFRAHWVEWRAAGIVALIAAGALGLWVYDFPKGPDEFLYLNRHFASAFLVIVVGFAHGFCLRRYRDICTPDEQTVARCLYGAVVLGLFALLTAETYWHFLRTVSDPVKALSTARMALAMAWGGYALVLLVVGFWRRMRPLRFAGLLLFGLALAKVVFVDMARMKQFYRVISFFVLGLLMIGTSYLYHLLEKRLEQTARPKE